MKTLYSVKVTALSNISYRERLICGETDVNAVNGSFRLKFLVLPDFIIFLCKRYLFGKKLKNQQWYFFVFLLLFSASIK